MLILVVFMVTGFEQKPGFLFICLRSCCQFPFVLDRDLSVLVPFACIILVVGDRADVPSLPVPGSIPPVLFPPSRELWILSARINLD